MSGFTPESNMHLPALLTAVAATAIAGCVITPSAENVDFEPATNKSYERREELPQVTARTEEELLASGYINLGRIVAEQTVENCWSGSYQCDPIPHGSDVTSELMYEAWDEGADLVVLTADRASAYEAIERDGQCIETELQCYPVLAPRYEEVCNQSGCRVVRRGNGEAQNCERACAKHEKIDGRARKETSTATIWRYEPEASK